MVAVTNRAMKTLIPSEANNSNSEGRELYYHAKSSQKINDPWKIQYFSINIISLISMFIINQIL